MFFYVDESGNTGNNLFDPNQTRLSYGLLSSRTNVDALCKAIHRQIQDEIKDNLIHANVLGVNGLTKIAPQLIQLQKKMRFDFDYYFIDKQIYALVHFFEAVFDAGLNEAVPWVSYWTPLRYLVIYNLRLLFDEDLLRESWRLCTIKNIDRYEEDVVRLLTEVRERAELSQIDGRAKEIIVDALGFGINKPLALDFGSLDPKMISPNAVGFQFVGSAIARRARQKIKRKTKNKKFVSSIVVDRQSEFNKAQITTHDYQRRMTDGLNKSSENERKYYIKHPLFLTLEEEDIALKGMPENDLTISKSADSIGLQIADVYLWMANKIISGATLSPELKDLWLLFAHRSLIDGISLEGMMQRFSNCEKLLPKYEELTEEQHDLAQATKEAHRMKVRSL